MRVYENYQLRFVIILYRILYQHIGQYDGLLARFVSKCACPATDSDLTIYSFAKQITFIFAITEKYEKILQIVLSVILICAYRRNTLYIIVTQLIRRSETSAGR